MIKLDNLEVEGFEGENRLVKVSLVSDTSGEVISIGNIGDTVVGLKENDIMTLGSTCFTASSELGVLNSAGVWTF